MYKKDKKCEQEFLKNFGKNLKVIIKSSGMTQKQFSEELGVSQDTITNWIQGNTFPQPLLLKNLIVYCLETPQITNFDIYNLFLYDTNLSDIEKNLIKLKEDYLDSKENNEKILDLKNKINLLEKENNKLKKENKELLKENKKFERCKYDYPYLVKELRIKEKNYKEKIKSEVLNEKFRDLINKCNHYITTLSKKVSNQTEISNMINNCSCQESKPYEELFKEFVELLSNEISRDLFDKFKNEMYIIIKNM